MKNTKLVSQIAFCIFAILVIQFIYFGITTSIQGIFESDSLIFHIPIAKQLATFTFWPANLTLGLGFLPATSKIILALFMILHLPINLFNVLGLVLLFIFAKKVGESFGLSKNLSITFAVVLSTLNSVLRWPLTQVEDIWVGVFFLIVLYLLKNPKENIKYYLFLGASMGMLIGMKFSGLIFGFLLLVFFGRRVFSKLNFANITAFFLPVTVLGFSWYVRNLILTENPFYPVGIFFLKGDPTYNSINSDNWSIFANVINNPKYIFSVGSALVSEFFVWAFSLILPIYLLIKKETSSVLKKLSVTSILIFVVFIFLFPAESLVSNMRHIYPLIFITILETFIFFQKKEEYLGALSIIGTAASLMNLNYYPKLLTLALMPMFYLIFVNKKFFGKVEKIS